MLIRVLGGFLMALADSVPGVSGGTIAFLMGIYDEFIGSLNNIVSKDKEKRKAAVLFLVKLGSGWIIGMAMASIIINQIFEKHIYNISSLFIGFVLFAMPIIIMEEKESIVGRYYNIVFSLIGAAVVVAVAYFSVHGVLGNGIDLVWGHFGLGVGIYLFVTAMFAISAMVLPGISGSTLLLVFGLYQAVIGAVSSFFKLDFTYLPALIIFGCGVIAGVLTVVKVLSYGLKKKRSAMMYFILGMMIGSFYAIAIGPASLKENPQPPMTLETFNVWFFLIGGVVIFGLQFLKTMVDKRDAAKK